MRKKDRILTLHYHHIDCKLKMILSFFFRRIYIYICRIRASFSLSLSVLPSSRLKLVLVKFFLITIVWYDVCSKIDLGIASLQSTNKGREREKEKREKEEA